MSQKTPATTKLMVNGEVTHLPDAHPTIGALLAHLKQSPQGIAIALNGHVLPQSQWDATTLCDGQHVEIVAPFQGG